MDKSKVRLTLTDSREVDFEGLFALPADRIELERRFNVSSQSIGTPEAREEWVLFLVYRMAVRDVQEFATASFEDFIAELAGYEFVPEASTPGPPTEPEASTG